MQGLLGGLSNVLETLRGEGAPPPACRAVVHASLRYVDAELLNALMLRRDACSISAVKALQVSNTPNSYPSEVGSAEVQQLRHVRDFMAPLEVLQMPGSCKRNWMCYTRCDG